MATYPGNDLVLKVATSAGSSAYTTIGLMTEHSVTISNENVDITNKDSSRWGSSAPYGKREVTISGSGIVSDNSAFAQLETVVQTSGTNLVYQVAYGISKTMTGSFIVNSLDYSGGAQTAQTFSVSLVSDGTITFA